jgi:hypothetical protein
MKNLLMLLVAVLGTTAMVNAQTTPAPSSAVKEIKATKHPKHQAVKKGKVEKNMAPKAQATPVKK